jgi:hypothetical protein
MIAEPRRLQHAVGIADAAQGPEREERLVFQALFAAARGGEQALALNRARRAAMTTTEVRRGERLAADRVGAVEARLPKLRVGSVPSRLNTDTFATVPMPRYLSVSDPTLRRRRTSAIRATSRGCAIEVSTSPRTTIAFRFFEPITAPDPPRPAWRPSLLIVAKRTSRSPATPIAAMHACPLAAGRRRACASSALEPASAAADRISIVSPSMARDASAGARPVITRASIPSRFSSTAK